MTFVGGRFAEEAKEVFREIRKDISDANYEIRIRILVLLRLQKETQEMRDIVIEKFIQIARDIIQELQLEFRGKLRLKIEEQIVKQLGENEKIGVFNFTEGTLHSSVEKYFAGGFKNITEPVRSEKEIRRRFKDQLLENIWRVIRAESGVGLPRVQHKNLKMYELWILASLGGCYDKVISFYDGAMRGLNQLIETRKKKGQLSSAAGAGGQEFPVLGEDQVALRADKNAGKFIC